MIVKVGDMVKNAMTTRTGVVMEVIRATFTGAPVRVIVRPVDQHGLSRRNGDTGFADSKETWSVDSIYVIS